MRRNYTAFTLAEQLWKQDIAKFSKRFKQEEYKVKKKKYQRESVQMKKLRTVSGRLFKSIF